MKNYTLTKEALIRVAKTFVQALIAFLVVALPTVDFSQEKSALKAALLGVLASAVAAGLSAVMNIEQKGGGNLLTFDKFKSKYLGKKTDYDGVCGVQCVDLAKLYMNKCFGFKPGAWGNAKDYWLSFEKHPELVENFVKIKNTPTFVPQKGDVVVWNENISSKNNYGHIAIATGEGDTTCFYSYDQNWGCEEMKKIKHNYYAVYGVLRPKSIKKTYKTVKANGGLKAYKALSNKEAHTLIPNNTKVELVSASAGTKTIKSKKYTMSKIKYNGATYYVAQTYLK